MHCPAGNRLYSICTPTVVVVHTESLTALQLHAITSSTNPYHPTRSQTGLTLHNEDYGWHQGQPHTGPLRWLNVQLLYRLD